MKSLSIDIVIPVLNEEKRLLNGIQNSINFLRKHASFSYKIIIADNGSTDRTKQIAEQLADNFKEVEYISTPKKGVGLALQTAWNESEADIVGYMDVDLSTDLSHLNEMYLTFQESNCDIVTGSRLKSESEVTNRKLIRTITSKGFNFLMRLICGVHITDGMCGFKFIKLDSFKKISQYGLKTEGWFFCAEMLIKASWLKMKIIEIPVIWTDDLDSKVKILKLSYNYLKELLRLRYEKSAWLLLKQNK